MAYIPLLTLKRNDGTTDEPFARVPSLVPGSSAFVSTFAGYTSVSKKPTIMSTYRPGTKQNAGDKRTYTLYREGATLPDGATPFGRIKIEILKDPRLEQSVADELATMFKNLAGHADILAEIRTGIANS